MAALLPIFIQVLPELFKLAADSPIVLNYINKSREVFQQHNVWDAAAEAEYQTHYQNLKANPPDWLKTDDQLGS